MKLLRHGIVRRPPLSLLFAASVVIAFCASNLHGGFHWWVLRSNQMYVELILWVVLPSTVWLLTVIVAAALHRTRALWLLVGAPLALYWPFKFVMLYLGCWTGSALVYMC
jgi:hypothetical protein